MPRLQTFHHHDDPSHKIFFWISAEHKAQTSCASYVANNNGHAGAQGSHVLLCRIHFHKQNVLRSDLSMESRYSQCLVAFCLSLSPDAFSYVRSAIGTVLIRNLVKDKVCYYFAVHTCLSQPN